jgi:two-component sensor histidine kinase
LLDVDVSSQAPAGRNHTFLGDGGEMGRLIRAHDWSTSTLGPPETWPQSLKTAVRLILTSRHPMFIWWGPDLIQFYNDAYRDTMGPERHPSALGGRGAPCWAEIWDIIGPQIALVMRGEGSTWHEDALVPVTRNGQREDVWWTYGYSPIDQDDGVGGVLVVCQDVTGRILGDRRQKLLLDELNHRVKNTLATVLSLAMLSGKSAQSTPEFVSVFTDRVHAMAKTHDLLIKTTSGAITVQDVLRAELAPYVEPDGQLELVCEAMELTPDAPVSLGLIVHELLTNAAKYGALSTLDGKLRVHCGRDADGGFLTWRETVSHPLAGTSRKGFGTRLIDRLARELGGSAKLDLKPTGLEAKITFSLATPAE